MSAAVYTVELDGKIIARRESLLWVRLDAPGLYVVGSEMCIRDRSLTGRFTTFGGVPYCRESRPLNSIITNYNGG